jgi:hypothetical protein
MFFLIFPMFFLTNFRTQEAHENASGKDVQGHILEPLAFWVAAAEFSSGFPHTNLQQSTLW